MDSWVDFVQMGDTGKTQMWDVVAKESGVVLGSVKWFGRWRKYSLFPRPETVWEQTCLRDVAAFIDERMAARRSPRPLCPRCKSKVAP